MSTVALFAPPFTFPTGASTDEANAHGAHDAEYAIVRRPEVRAPDVERTDAEVIEVTMRWGRTVLAVVHAPLDGTIVIGEGDGASLLVPRELLGVDRCVLVDRGTLVVPSAGRCERAGRVDLVSGARTNIALGEGDRAMTLHVARVAAARPTPRRSPARRSLLAAFAGTALAQAAAIIALQHAPAAALTQDDTTMDRETQAYLLQLQSASAPKEVPANATPDVDGSGGGQTGGAHAGDPGQSGVIGGPPTNATYAIKGPAESEAEHLARVRTEIEENRYLALGALQQVFGAMNRAPIDAASQWDRELGHDATSANGHVVGDAIGDASGWNGLGLLAMGPGGGNAFGDHLGMGIVGPFGHGNGIGCGVGTPCFGGGTTMKGSHAPHVVQPLESGAAVEGNGIPPEVVRRMVRANMPRFGACYEQGLKRDPSLEGVVTTRFVIDETGAVEATQIASGTKDGAVNACIAGVFSTLSFPVPDTAPNGASFGKARVTYSITFGHD